MDYEIGKRIIKKLKFNGFVGTYEGGNIAYYGVRAYFKDENNQHIHWDTTYKGIGILSELSEGEWYDLKMTITDIEIYESYNRISVNRVIKLN